MLYTYMFKIAQTSVKPQYKLVCKESQDKVKRDVLSNGTDDNVLLDTGRM